MQHPSQPPDRHDIHDHQVLVFGMMAGRVADVEAADRWGPAMFNNPVGALQVLVKPLVAILNASEGEVVTCPPFMYQPE